MGNSKVILGKIVQHIIREKKLNIRQKFYSYYNYILVFEIENEVVEKIPRSLLNQL